MTHDTFWLSLGLLLTGYGPCAEPAPIPAELWGTDKPSTLESAPAAPSAQAPARAPAAPVLARGHSFDTTRMRQAALAGQLLEYQRAAAVIASDAWSSTLPANGRPQVEAVRRAAVSASGSSTLPAAAAALGALGAACATCHQNLGGLPGTTTVPPLDTSEGSMPAHAAAEATLWQGLVLPSDALWSRGARALGSAPALDSDVAEISSLAHRTRALAGEAATAPPDTRGESYGMILATCSACHSQLGIRPGR